MSGSARLLENFCIADRIDRGKASLPKERIQCAGGVPIRAGDDGRAVSCPVPLDAAGSKDSLFPGGRAGKAILLCSLPGKRKNRRPPEGGKVDQGVILVKEYGLYHETFFLRSSGTGNVLCRKAEGGTLPYPHLLLSGFSPHGIRPERNIFPSLSRPLGQHRGMENGREDKKCLFLRCAGNDIIGRELAE